MSKTLTLTLTEQEYTHLLQHYLIGHLLWDEISDPSKAEIIYHADFLNKYCKVGYEAKVKGFKQLAPDLYSFPNKMEDTMLETQTDYIEYIESGEREESIEALKQQLEQMRKDGLL